MLANRNFPVLGLCIFVFSLAVWKLIAHGGEPARYNLDRVLAVGSMGTGVKADTGNRDLIVYAYAETDEARKNFAFFRRHALHAKADFIFMLNGEHTVDLTESRHLPNVRIIERENKCFDLGGFHEIFTANETLGQHYKRFLFMNASLRGPFFPAYADNVCWSDAYFGKLSNTTRLVGMTWNCATSNSDTIPIHLQSMIWAMERDTLNNIVLPNLKCFEDMGSAIHEGETQIAGKVMEAGYEVYAFEGRFNAHAISPDSSGRVGGEKNATAFMGWCKDSGSNDVLLSGYYDGSTMSPFETIFAKTNRPWEDRDRRMIDVLTAHVDFMGFSSYDRCV